jgi:polar amino acid transport system permease protein
VATGAGGPDPLETLPGPGAPGPVGSRGPRLLGGGGRSVLVALTSTVVFFGVATLLIVSSPGWPTIKGAFFDGAVFADSWPKIWERFGLNVFIFTVAEVFVLILAMVLAILRSLPGPVFFPLRLLSASYTYLFRGLPTILVILLLGFGAPALGLRGVPDSDLFWAIVALVLVYSAYVAEVYRAGIDSIHPSQAAAARSLGLTRGQALRYVVVPQAVRRVIPPLLNDFIGLQKDSALVAALGGVIEGLRETQIITAARFDFTPFVVLALIYVIITIPQALAVDWLVARDRRRQLAGGAL